MFAPLGANSPPGGAGRYDCTLEGCGPPNLPVGGEGSGTRFHLCLRRISGAGRRGLAEGAQRRGARRGRDRPRSRRGGSLATVMGRAVSRAFPARSRERGYFITDCRGLQPEKAPRAKGAGRAACRKSPPAAAFSARSLRNVCAQGRKLPARPAPEGSVCPVGTWAEGPKRPGGGERNEQRVRVAPSAKIERPGKAGRYEFTLEDLRVLQTSPNGLFDSLSAPRKRRGARRDAAYSALGPAATTSALMWVYFLKFSTKLLASSLALAS